MKKRIICTLLTLCFILALAPVYASAVTIDNPFTDVSHLAAYRDAVLWAYDTGITSGKSATLFAPDDTCTRGQVVTFLWRAMGEPEPESEYNPFTDVKAGDYFYKAVLWAVEKNITKGTSTTTFSPGNTCTYGQVITFLWRCNGEPEAFGWSEYSTMCAKYCIDAVAWAESTGLLRWPPDIFVDDAECPRSSVLIYLHQNAGAPDYDFVPKTHQNDIPAADIGFDSAAALSDAIYSDGWIYYCEDTDIGPYEGRGFGGWLTKIRPDGTGKQLLVKECVCRPQISNGYVYYTKWYSTDGFDRKIFGQLWRIKTDGTDNSKVVNFGNDENYDDFVVYGDYIFVSTAIRQENKLTYGIWRQKLDGSERVLISNDSASTDMTIMDGRLYCELIYGGMGADYAMYCRNTSLCSMNLDGSDIQRYDDNGYFYRMYNGRIYWVDNNVCPDLAGLYVRDADGSNVTRLTSTTNVAFLPHDDYVYYGDYGRNDYFTFNRVKIDGTGSEELLKLTDSEPGLVRTFTDMWYHDGAIIFKDKAFREGKDGWEFVQSISGEAPVFGQNSKKYETAKGDGLFDAQLSMDFNFQYDTSYSVVNTNGDSIGPVDDKPGEGTRISPFHLGRATQYVFEQDGSYVNIRLDGTELYMGVRAGVQEICTDLILWSKTGSDSQRFELVMLNDREFKLKTTKGLYVSVGEMAVEGMYFEQPAYMLSKSEVMASVFTLSVKG